MAITAILLTKKKEQITKKIKYDLLQGRNPKQVVQLNTFKPV